MRRGNCQQDPSPGTSPMRTNASANSAFSDAMRMSHESASPRPTPIAWPFTAAMVGFCTSLIRSGTLETEPNPASAFSDARWPCRASMSPHGNCCRSARASSSCSIRPITSSNLRMFAPEQNDGSRPVSTSTRSAPFDSNASSSAYTSAAISPLRAFRVSAWSSVMSTTPPVRWTSMNSPVTFLLGVRGRPAFYGEPCLLSNVGEGGGVPVTPCD